MDTGIGATLREARNRRKVDLSQVEAAIKIRVRYLRAIENEEWDVLPGDAYTRGFIRTYAYYLGLDGERLAEEYRRSAGQAAERVPTRVDPVPGAARRQRSRFAGRARVALVVVAMAGLLVAVGLLAGDGDSGSPGPAPAPERQDGGGGAGNGGGQGEAVAERRGVELRLAATGEVWACVLDQAGEELIDGEILAAGEEAGPFRAGRYELAFGNGEVRLTIDGEPAQTPASGSPVGYEISGEGELTALEEGERPDCE